MPRSAAWTRTLGSSGQAATIEHALAVGGFDRVQELGAGWDAIGLSAVPAQPGATWSSAGPSPLGRSATI
jgi:hypothetical protein